jgi:hypothetical protein
MLKGRVFNWLVVATAFGSAISLGLAESGLGGHDGGYGRTCLVADSVQYGPISNNETRYGPMYLTYRADWWAALDYIAKRHNGQEAILSEWMPGGTQWGTNAPNYVDVYRHTGIQRAGYSSSAWSMWDSSHYSNCGV